MPDVFSKAKRSEVMSRIRGKNTKPEIMMRSLLHKAGCRFRIHAKTLPGKPDIVLKRHQAVIFVHGCFWHGHKCPQFKMPETRKEFWREKIQRNRRNDRKAISALKAQGWRVLVVWECAMKGKDRFSEERIVDETTGWLYSDSDFREIRGSRGK